MRIPSRTILITLVAGTLGWAPVSFAAERCTGTFTNVVQSSETIDLGNGVSLTTFSLRGGNQSNLGTIAVGGCSGYALAMPDGKLRVVYACARKTKDGDVWVDEGSLEPGAERGTWKATVSTGAMAKLFPVGSNGWWQATTNDGKVTAGIWEGTCK